MPGYLHHIAARVGGTATAVKPRLPSRFEPVRTAGSVEGTPLVREMAEEVPESAMRLGGELAARPKSLVPAGAPRDKHASTFATRVWPLATERESSAGEGAQDARREEAATTGIARPAGGGKSARSIGQLVRAKDLSSKEEETPAISRDTQREKNRGKEGKEAETAGKTSLAQAFAGSLPGSFGKTAPDFAARAPKEASGEKAPAGPPHDIGEVTNVRESSAEAPLVIVPAPGPFSWAPAEAQRAEAPAPRQEIQIVIGKLTVQAGAPAAHALLPPAPRPAPKVTLEQYLSQRGSGR